jgi:Holliday junction resolvase RusA-like endonuclease
MARNGHVYTPKSADAWKTAVKSALLIQQHFTIKPLTVPLHLMVQFYFPMPKRLQFNKPVFHIHTPDLDNLLKSTMDALTDVGAWRDDALVCKMTAYKWYTPDRTSIGANIIIASDLK